MKLINIILVIIVLYFIFKTKIIEKMAPFPNKNNYLDHKKFPYTTNIEKDAKRVNIETNPIYDRLAVNASYDTDTIYDKLINVFSKQENEYYNCENADKEDQEDYIRELNMVFRLIAVPTIVFNRGSLPISKDSYKKDVNNKLLPIAQSAIDVFNEKLNKTCIITDLRDITVLTTEEEKQYTFNVYLNFPTINQENHPIFKNLKIKMVLVRRRLIKDDIFTPNRYDTTKFVIKEMKLLNAANINSQDKELNPINKYDENYYSYDTLLREDGQYMTEQDIEKEMLRNRKKHEHEMDFRNITIEDDNYLNDYMIPHKACKP
jgi:hypothetical protein